MINERLFKTALTLHGKGQYDEAEKKYDLLLKAEPTNPHVLHAKGLLYAAKGSPEQALQLFQAAVNANSHLPIVRQSIGKLFEDMQKPVEAASAYADYATILIGNGKYAEALDACDKSLSLNPTPVATQIRGLAEQQLGDPFSSEKIHHATIFDLKKRARTARDFMALSEAYQALDDRENALRACEKALKLKPIDADAHWTGALLILAQGDFRRGFEAYEHRWDKESGYGEKSRIGFRQPMWQGQSPQALGGPLLVVAEQALGDNIHFARYAKMLADAGHDVLFEVDFRLVSLFREGFDGPRLRTIPRQHFYYDKWRLGWVERTLGRKPQKPAPTSVYRDMPFAAWIGSMSLPLYFGTTADAMPGNTPYLSIKPSKIARWRGRIGERGEKPRIGLVWSGDPAHPDNYKRSIDPGLLLPLVQRGDALFYSLQKGKPADYEFPDGTVTRLDHLLTDFTETGAAMECLDLIISVDTAPLHLAGALNRPVWGIMPKVKDWRWLMEGETTGWYPSARLFRHPAPRDWKGTVANVGAALDEWIAAWKAG